MSPPWIGPSRRLDFTTKIRSPTRSVGIMASEGTEKGWSNDALRNSAATVATTSTTNHLARSLRRYRTRGRAFFAGRVGTWAGAGRLMSSPQPIVGIAPRTNRPWASPAQVLFAWDETGDEAVFGQVRGLADRLGRLLSRAG